MAITDYPSDRKKKTCPAALKPKIGAKAENQEVNNPSLKLWTSSTFVPAEANAGCQR